MNDWLPALIKFNGDWPKYLEQIYAQFYQDFEVTKPKWSTGQRVSLKKHPKYDNKSATFWHMISEGHVEEDRIPNIRRCERISWLKVMMEKFDNKKPDQTSEVFWWKEKRGSEERFVISLTDFSYVLVVADRGDYVLPWTAYLVEYNHQRKKLKSKYGQYWALKG